MVLCKPVLQLWLAFISVCLIIGVVCIDKERFSVIECENLFAVPYGTANTSAPNVADVKVNGPQREILPNTAFSPSLHKVGFMVENTTSNSFNPFYRYILYPTNTAQDGFVNAKNISAQFGADENAYFSYFLWKLIPVDGERIRLNRGFYVSDGAENIWWHMHENRLSSTVARDRRMEFYFKPKYSYPDGSEIMVDERGPWVHLYTGSTKLWPTLNGGVHAAVSPPRGVIPAKYSGTFFLNFFLG